MSVRGHPKKNQIKKKVKRLSKTEFDEENYDFDSFQNDKINNAGKKDFNVKSKTNNDENNMKKESFVNKIRENVRFKDSVSNSKQNMNDINNMNDIIKMEKEIENDIESMVKDKKYRKEAVGHINYDIINEGRDNSVLKNTGKVKENINVKKSNKSIDIDKNTLIDENKRKVRENKNDKKFLMNTEEEHNKLRNVKVPENYEKSENISKGLVRGETFYKDIEKIALISRSKELDDVIERLMDKIDESKASSYVIKDYENYIAKCVNPETSDKMRLRLVSSLAENLKVDEEITEIDEAEGKSIIEEAMIIKKNIGILENKLNKLQKEESLFENKGKVKERYNEDIGMIGGVILEAYQAREIADSKRFVERANEMISIKLLSLKKMKENQALDKERITYEKDNIEKHGMHSSDFILLRRLLNMQTYSMVISKKIEVNRKVKPNKDVSGFIKSRKIDKHDWFKKHERLRSNIEEACSYLITEEVKNKVIALFKETFDSYKSMKNFAKLHFIFGLYCTFLKLGPDGKVVSTEEVVLNSKHYYYLENTNIWLFYMKSIAEIVDKIGRYGTSSMVVGSIESLFVEFTAQRIDPAGRYIESPPEIAKFIFNPKNTDNDCLRYCINEVILDKECFLRNINRKEGDVYIKSEIVGDFHSNLLKKFVPFSVDISNTPIDGEYFSTIEKSFDKIALSVYIYKGDGKIGVCYTSEKSPDFNNLPYITARTKEIESLRSKFEALSPLTQEKEIKIIADKINLTRRCYNAENKYYDVNILVLEDSINKTYHYTLIKDFHSLMNVKNSEFLCKRCLKINKKFAEYITHIKDCTGVLIHEDTQVTTPHTLEVDKNVKKRCKEVVYYYDVESILVRKNTIFSKYNDEIEDIANFMFNLVVNSDSDFLTSLINEVYLLELSEFVEKYLGYFDHPGGLFDFKYETLLKFYEDFRAVIAGNDNKFIKINMKILESLHIKNYINKHRVVAVTFFRVETKYSEEEQKYITKQKEIKQIIGYDCCEKMLEYLIKRHDEEVEERERVNRSKYRGKKLEIENDKLFHFTYTLLAHNASKYDLKFIITAAGNLKLNISGIFKSEELPITITLNYSLVFKDTFRFLKGSLQKLYTSFKGERLIEGARTDGKGVVPYEFYDSIEALLKQDFPQYDCFYNTLTDSLPDYEDYLAESKFYTDMKFNSRLEHFLWYNKNDVLILAEVFQQFRTFCLRKFSIDPVVYCTLSSFSYAVFLSKLQDRLEHIQSVRMYEFFEKGKKGGICNVTTRYVKANNEYCEDFDPSKPKSYIIQWDIRSSYGYSMTKNLPASDFQFIDKTWSYEDIKKISNDDEKGYYFDVDIEYPEVLHDDHNELPLLSCHKNILFEEVLRKHKDSEDKIQTNEYNEVVRNVHNTNLEELKNSGSRKLLSVLENRKSYICHGEMLKYLLLHGLIITKINNVIEFKQKKFCAGYIEELVEMRRNEKDDLTREILKLLINSIYGKLLQNPRTFESIQLLNLEDDFDSKLLALSSIKMEKRTILSDNLVAVHYSPRKICLDSLIAAGVTISEFGKLELYKFHYDYIKQNKFGKAKLCYIDTDSLTYLIESEDISSYISSMSGALDNSVYQASCAHYSTNNKGKIGYFVDEYPNSVILEGVFVKPKAYSFKYVTNGSFSEKKRLKGVTRNVIKNINFDHYKNTVLGLSMDSSNKIKYIKNKEHIYLEAKNAFIKSHKNSLYTILADKIILSSFDDKRYQEENKIDTLAYGHYKIEK